MDTITASSSSSPQKTFAHVFYHTLMFIGVRSEDLVFLWTTCRAVSRGFKDAVERVFIARHLKKTFLKADGGTTRRPEHGNMSLSTEFSFSHLDAADRTRAVFHVADCADEIKPILARTLAKKFEDVDLLSNPQIVVQVRHEANDTHIPDFAPDWPALEIRCDWMGMYSEWFREEREHTRRLQEFMENAKTRALDVRARIDAGEMDLMQSFSVMMRAFADAEREAWSAIRKERIGRNVCAREGTSIDQWDGEPEPAGYERVDRVRRAIGRQGPFSDEEDEDEEAGGDGDDSDEGEGSEWEDEEDEEEAKEDAAENHHT